MRVKPYSDGTRRFIKRSYHTGSHYRHFKEMRIGGFLWQIWPPKSVLWITSSIEDIYLYRKKFRLLFKVNQCLIRLIDK